MTTVEGDVAAAASMGEEPSELRMNGFGGGGSALCYDADAPPSAPLRSTFPITEGHLQFCHVLQKHEYDSSQGDKSSAPRAVIPNLLAGRRLLKESL